MVGISAGLYFGSFKFGGCRVTMIWLFAGRDLIPVHTISVMGVSVIATGSRELICDWVVNAKYY